MRILSSLEQPVIGALARVVGQESFFNSVIRIPLKAIHQVAKDPRHVGVPDVGDELLRKDLRLLGHVNHLRRHQRKGLLDA